MPAGRACSTGSFAPIWSRDGRTLYYSSPDGIYKVAFGDTDPPGIGSPTLFLAGDQISGDVQGFYAVVGDRFLGLKYATRPTPEPLRLIRNWRSLLDE